MTRIADVANNFPTLLAMVLFPSQISSHIGIYHSTKKYSVWYSQPHKEKQVAQSCLSYKLLSLHYSLPTWTEISLSSRSCPRTNREELFHELIGYEHFSPASSTVGHCFFSPRDIAQIILRAGQLPSTYCKKGSFACLKPGCVARVSVKASWISPAWPFGFLCDRREMRAAEQPWWSLGHTGGSAWSEESRKSSISDIYIYI